jgi:hypothetical protein
MRCVTHASALAAAATTIAVRDDMAVEEKGHADHKIDPSRDGDGLRSIDGVLRSPPCVRRPERQLCHHTRPI